MEFSKDFNSDPLKKEFPFFTFIILLNPEIDYAIKNCFTPYPIAI